MARSTLHTLGEFGNEIFIEILIQHHIPRYSFMEQNESVGGIIRRIRHVLNQDTSDMCLMWVHFHSERFSPNGHDKHRSNQHEQGQSLSCL